MVDPSWVSRRREILCGFSARVDSRFDARCSQVKKKPAAGFGLGFKGKAAQLQREHAQERQFKEAVKRALDTNYSLSDHETLDEAPKLRRRAQCKRGGTSAVTLVDEPLVKPVRNYFWRASRVTPANATLTTRTAGLLEMKLGPPGGAAGPAAPRGRAGGAAHADHKKISSIKDYRRRMIETVLAVADARVTDAPDGPLVRAQSAAPPGRASMGITGLTPMEEILLARRARSASPSCKDPLYRLGVYWRNELAAQTAVFNNEDAVRDAAKFSARGIERHIPDGENPYTKAMERIELEKTGADTSGDLIVKGPTSGADATSPITKKSVALTIDERPSTAEAIKRGALVVHMTKHKETSLIQDLRYQIIPLAAEKAKLKKAFRLAEILHTSLSLGQAAKSAGVWLKTRAKPIMDHKVDKGGDPTTDAGSSDNGAEESGSPEQGDTEVEESGSASASRPATGGGAARFTMADLFGGPSAVSFGGLMDVRRRANFLYHDTTFQYFYSLVPYRWLYMDFSHRWGGRSGNDFVPAVRTINRIFDGSGCGVVQWISDVVRQICRDVENEVCLAAIDGEGGALPVFHLLPVAPLRSPLRAQLFQFVHHDFFGVERENAFHGEVCAACWRVNICPQQPGGVGFRLRDDPRP